MKNTACVCVCVCVSVSMCELNLIYLTPPPPPPPPPHTHTHTHTHTLRPTHIHTPRHLPTSSPVVNVLSLTTSRFNSSRLHFYPHSLSFVVLIFKAHGELCVCRGIQNRIDCLMSEPTVSREGLPTFLVCDDDITSSNSISMTTNDFKVHLLPSK